MSEENSPIQEPAATESTAKSRVRRVSNPRPKKSASVKAEKKTEAAAPAEASLPAETVPSPAPVSAPEAPVAKSAPAPVRDEVADNTGDSAGSQEWPEPETISEGPGAPGEGKRNKRRRRKGKGGQNASSGGNEDSGGQQPRGNGGQQSGGGQQSAPQPSGQQQHGGQSHQHSPRIPVDPEALAKKAWRIYLSEVSEEGIALINDHDAKELSRRCFRLAEIFLDEQNRRIRQ